MVTVLGEYRMGQIWEDFPGKCEDQNPLYQILKELFKIIFRQISIGQSLVESLEKKLRIHQRIKIIHDYKKNAKKLKFESEKQKHREKYPSCGIGIGRELESLPG